MAYIKKIIMQGFKSFVRKTEIPFNPGINVILGPNGSGKSNISEALCFVLGRLSAKSMRAAKSSNLIFMGTKSIPAVKEASVEIVFENSDRVFSIDKEEVSIKRIVRKNGQGIYKIDHETKTRQEVLTLLAQAGIDPNGFNIILQNEIPNFVQMHTEERRKIIEEVSGISVYEARKEKSLRELEKTEEKLKELASILRERMSYLNNLEKERQVALRFKKIQEDIQKYKASIIYFDLTRKNKEKQKINEGIEKKQKEIEKIKKQIITTESTIQGFKSKIDAINSKIQKSAGLEQEKLNYEIANLRAELAGLNVKLENYEKKLSEIEIQKREIETNIKENELSLNELKNESPHLEKKTNDIEKKKKQLEEYEDKRKKFYLIKSELKSIRERIQDKTSILQSYKNESEFILKSIKSVSEELFDIHTTQEKVNEQNSQFQIKKQILEKLDLREKEIEKIIYASESEIEKNKKIMENISGIDICPLCKSRITEEHIKSIKLEVVPRVELLEKEINSSDKELSEISNKRKILKQDIERLTQEISGRKTDLINLQNIEDKKNQIKSLQEKINDSEKELAEMNKRRKMLEKNFDENSNIEQKYETVRIEFQEMSLRSKENVSSEISLKQRELERYRIMLKQIEREKQDLTEELAEINQYIEEKNSTLKRKKLQEEELSKKFHQLIKERDAYYSDIRENEIKLNSQRIETHKVEEDFHMLKVDMAKTDAEIENFETEMLKFNNIEVIKINREALVLKLNRSQDEISRIGSVNMRSLEVYEEIKKEYDLIKEKAEVIEKEKQGIIKIINEIDLKKKKTFLNTLNALNEVFTRKFAQLSEKGEVWLELENKKSPFEGGVAITVKTGHGKYFDATSLSGGEQALVAISLIFSIQELNPYCFYILDEIDRDLDKRNSSRLAALLKKHIQKGQYIVVTHNDEVITQATNLYGVSMHEGVSKIISLKV